MKATIPQLSRRSGSALRFAAVVLALSSVAIVVNAQSATDGKTPLALSPGAPAGSYPLSALDNVNLFNGNLNFRLPLLGFSGRGGIGYAISLPIEQKWRVEHYVDPYNQEYNYPDPDLWGGLEPGYSPGVMQARHGGDNVQQCPYAPYDSYFYKTLTRLTFTSSDGTEYELRDQATNGQPATTSVTPSPYGCTIPAYNRGKVFVTADGTAATFVSDSDVLDDAIIVAGGNVGVTYPSGYLVLRDGTRYRIDIGLVSWIHDRNGNRLTFSYDSGRVTTATDSLNRQVLFSYANLTTTFYDQVTFKGFGGASRSLKVWYANLDAVLRSGYSLQTHLQLFPELNSSSSIFNPMVVSSVELPNGRSYQFFYNPYAELARVALPSGGAFEYDYGPGVVGEILHNQITNSLAPATSGVTGYAAIYRRVVEKRVYSDGTTLEGRVTFSRPESYNSGSALFENVGYVVVDQMNGESLVTRAKHYYFGSARNSLFTGATEYAEWKQGREYQTESLAPNGTTGLQREMQTFAQRASVPWWTASSDLAPPNDPRVIESVSTMADANLVSKQTFGYDDSVPYNNRNSVKEYDFGTGAPGSLVRETRTTFITSSTYTGNNVHLRSLPSQVSVYEGTAERARTTFEYDNYSSTANHAALTDRSGISGFDSSFNTIYTTRGNVTATTHYLLTNGSVTGSISNYAQFDIAGNVVKTIDGRGYITTIQYDDRFGTPDGNARFNSAPLELSSVAQASYAFPTLVTNALGHTIYAQFDYYLGRPVDGEDGNGVSASGYYNDALDRPMQVRRAVGTTAASQTTFAYDDANRTITTTSDLSTNNDNALVSKVLYDGLGRTTETRQHEGGTNYIAVQNQYDALGRAFKTSNPFRPWQSEAAVWTTTAFDALGRVTSVTTPDNAVVTTAYSGSAVTVTDQAGKQRKSVTDALGRLTSVYEDPSGWNYLTSYNYDVLDNLTTVSQGGQTRTFVYDSLKRLTSATNPESGTINYTYDNNGNLLTKTDARGIISTYVYDALNRNTTLDYSNTTTISPDITRVYDGATNGKGRFWYSYAGGDFNNGSNVEHTAIDSYDALGKPLVQRQIFKTNGVWGSTYQTSRSYNLAGGVTSQTYPSQRTVSFSYDNAGRTNSFSGNLGGTNRTYATGMSYSSFGSMTVEQFGTDIALYNKRQYNIRGQLWDVRVGIAPDVNGSWNRGCLQFFYDSSYGFGTSGPDNNGNVLKSFSYFEDSQTGTWAIHRDTYNYDSLNRITSVAEHFVGNGQPETQQFLQAYQYDRYGNRTIDAAASWGGVNEQQFTVNTANNRLGVPAGQSGAMTYDNAGNLTTDTYSGSATARAYDAENRMVSETQGGSLPAATYTYNADGQRVRRKVNDVETWQVYGMDGELLAEYAASTSATSPQKEYGYRNGELLITAEAPAEGGGSGPQNVAWTNAVGVSVSGNTITKTAADSWGNAGAVSSQTIASGDGYVEFTVSQSSMSIMYGLGNGDTNQSYTDIDFAFALFPGGDVHVYENGTYRGPFGSYAVGDVFRVAVEGGVVKYKKNGTVVYTSVVAPTYPLSADAALYTNGNTISNAVISGAASGGGGGSWTNAVGVTVSGGTLTKTAADSWGNAGAVSTQSITSGDGYAEFTGNQTGHSRMVGLGNGDSNQSYTDIDFAIGLFPGGDAHVYENGTYRLAIGSYTSSDVFRVAVEGGVVKYKKNGTVVYTSTVTPTYPLLVDTSIYSNGSTISNVVISGGGGGGSSANIKWLVSDHLGTPRMIADETGSLAGIKRHDYLPFGEELLAGTGGRTLAQGYSGDNVRQKFTLKERDIETGLDYFLARYYSSTQGRFTTPDEFSGGPDELYSFVDDAADNPTFYADLTNPQSLNKYQYTYNNPVNMVDPDGHCPPEAAALCRAAPVVFSIPGLREAAAGAAVVVILAKAIDAIPGDKTAGDGSCPSCERSLKAGQQRMERQEAARQSELKRQNDVNNLQQAQGGASGQTPKPEATGTTSSGRPTDRYGNPLGPSGREMRHDRDHPSRSRAQEAARRRGKGAPENHPNPTRGRGHFHPTGQDGKKVPNSTHENYPARSSHPKKQRTSPNE